MKSIYKVIATIPSGRVATYGQIAKKLNTSPRAVGQALHRNTDPAHYPCHRVVFADGRVSVAYAFGGAVAQRRKLLAEGVAFVGDCVDMVRCRFVF